MDGETTSISDILRLPWVCEIEISDSHCLRIPICQSPPTRISLEITPGLGYIELYANNSQSLPTPEIYTWSVGLSAFEKVTDPDHYSPNPATFVNTNPYDAVLPRNFTRSPSQLPISPNKNFGNYGKTLNFCISSEEWEGIPPYCCVALKNLTNAPLKLNIAITEYLEHTLLPESMKQSLELFNNIFENIEGSRISRAETKSRNLGDNKEFTYGEIELLDIAPVFALCCPKADDIFWDIGCGAGKCLVAVALLYPQFRAICGVEYLEQLSECCRRNIETLSDQRTRVVCGDLRNVDWSDADIIYCSNICFGNELNEGLFKKCCELKKGAKMVVLKNFADDYTFKLLYNSRITMSWGRTQIYILEKIL